MNIPPMIFIKWNEDKTSLYFPNAFGAAIVYGFILSHRHATHRTCNAWGRITFSLLQRKIASSLFTAVPDKLQIIKGEPFEACSQMMEGDRR